ncbi:PAS domain S-box protein [Prolixibacteraceae bacterium JC049]|nr:PAS domain S-box protein [Prolixibacteraceae bacterium JC049]
MNKTPNKEDIIAENKELKRQIAILEAKLESSTNISDQEDYLKEMNQVEQMVSLGHWELDLKSNELYWSDEVYRIFGLEPQSVPADYHLFLSYVHPEDRDELDRVFQKSVTERSKYEMDHRILFKDGTIKYVYESGIIKCDEHDNPIKAIGTVWNITDRKQLEIDLREAKEVAEQNNRLKTEFLQNISHEIRTPMNGILGFCEILEHTKLSEEQAEYLGIIKNSSSRLLNNITKILELSKLITKEETPNIESFNLSTFFSRISKKFNTASTNKGVSLQAASSINPENSIFLSDQGKMEKIISYIFENALDYSSDGKIDFTVRQENDNVLFSVSDEGIGIAEEFQADIFMPFYQIQHDTQINDGLGIGLAIAKLYADLISAQIDLKSEINRGSKFTLIVPNSTTT